MSKTVRSSVQWDIFRTICVYLYALQTGMRLDATVQIRCGCRPRVDRRPALTQPGNLAQRGEALTSKTLDSATAAGLKIVADIFSRRVSTGALHLHLNTTAAWVCHLQNPSRASIEGLRVESLTEQRASHPPIAGVCRCSFCLSLPLAGAVCASEGRSRPARPPAARRSGDGTRDHEVLIYLCRRLLVAEPVRSSSGDFRTDTVYVVPWCLAGIRPPVTKHVCMV